MQMPLHLFPCQSWWGEAQRHSVDALGELLDNVNIKVDDPCHLDFFHKLGPSSSCRRCNHLTAFFTQDRRAGISMTHHLATIFRNTF